MYSTNKSLSVMQLQPFASAQYAAPKIILRVLTILLFVWMLVIGVFKLIGTEPALVETFRQMHYLEIMPFVGILEILGGIGLLLARVRHYAALGLLFLFVGGLASHLASATYSMVPLTATAILMTMCVIRFDNRVHIAK